MVPSKIFFWGIVPASSSTRDGNCRGESQSVFKKKLAREHIKAVQGDGCMFELAWLHA